MSHAILIVEDNHYKIQRIFRDYEELFHGKPVYIARSVAQAQAFIDTDPGTITVFLDFELLPGCGTGMEVLSWLERRFKHFLDLVIVTSYSSEKAREMASFCQTAGIPVERLR